MAAFIDMLVKYQRFVDEAKAAGVTGVLDVPQVFLTADEVANRYAYAKRALGLD